MAGPHHAHNFVLQGRTLFVNIGSATNACQQRDRVAGSLGNNPCTELNTRAGIWEFDTNRLHQTASDGHRFATGLRNSVALTRNPIDGYLYATVHGRDQLHDNWPNMFSEQKSAENPGEELVRVDRGSDYGWPYCYYDVDLKTLVLAPEYGGDGRKTAQCSGKTQPLMAFPGHWAPNDIVFYTGNQFPQRYRNGAFVALHGSWNRSVASGYKVVFFPMNNGKPGPIEDFLGGFLTMTGANGSAIEVWGRPVGVTVARDGSLLVSDDASNRIWKISAARK